jgi:hypothetical protein
LKKQLAVVLEQFEVQTALETAQQQIYFKLGLLYYMREKAALNEVLSQINFFKYKKTYS